MASHQRAPRGGPSATQPRPHSDIPGISDDRYVAAWRKRGPVTLLGASGGATTAADATSSANADSSTATGEIRKRDNDDDRDRNDDGVIVGDTLQLSSKPHNPKLHQTIQEVLSESSNESTDEFLGAESRPRNNEGQQTSYSPAQVSIRVRRSEHLTLDESGETETNHHVIPVLSV